MRKEEENIDEYSVIAYDEPNINSTNQLLYLGSDEIIEFKKLENEEGWVEIIMSYGKTLYSNQLKTH